MKILHLEDNLTDALLISDLLSREYVPCHIARVETRQTFVEALDQSEWDIILADHSLPSFDGNSALKLAVAKCPDIPFIFVSGTLGEERAVEVIKNGATDFILKHRLDRLVQVVARARRECDSARARRSAEQEVRASLREKELLLQEIHHRVNNNFQIICSLLHLQADAADDSRQTPALLQSLKRIEVMARAHTMLYASSNLQDIDFAEYVHVLATDVQRWLDLDPSRTIRLDLELEPIRLDIDRAIPCGLILNELLSNAVKYAFPNSRNGEVRVLLKREERNFLVTVEDSGVGLPRDHGFDAIKSAGFSIVRALTKQLRGDLEVTSGRGSRFDLRFA